MERDFLPQNREELRANDYKFKRINEVTQIFALYYRKVYAIIRAKPKLSNWGNYNIQLEKLQKYFEGVLPMNLFDINDTELLIAELCCQSVQNLEWRLDREITNFVTTAVNQYLPFQNTGYGRNAETSNALNYLTYMPEIEEFNSNLDMLIFFSQRLRIFERLNLDQKFNEHCDAIDIHVMKSLYIWNITISQMNEYISQNMITSIVSQILEEVDEISQKNINYLDEYYIFQLAKKFIDYTVNKIMSNVDYANPIAAILMAICVRIPVFEKYLISHIYVNCNFLVPILRQRTAFKDDFEYKLFYKFKYCTLNSCEDLDSYKYRQIAFVRLFATLMVSGNPQYPFRLRNGWIWLKKFIHTKPEMKKICSSILTEFLKVTSHHLLVLYGKRFKDMIFDIRAFYVPKLHECEDPNNDSIIELVRLLNSIIE